MYVDFFGLRELPFNNTPDPRFFYSTPDHEEALASLVYAVQSRKGFVLLTGEVGAGKTLVSRLMLRRFGSQIAFANINHAVQSAHDLMEALCTEFDLPLPNSTTHAQLVRTLHDFLLTQFAQNRPVVLILDEAQNLPDEAFEQLRMIGNLEADDAKLLQICIVGQPELQARFAAPNLRQLRQRLYRTFHLPALDRKSTENYMRHRLSVSGGRLEDIFRPEAVDEVARLSRGLPRLINTICDNALLSAYAADQRHIDGAFVRTVSAQMMLVDTDENSGCIEPGVTSRKLPARNTLESGTERELSAGHATRNAPPSTRRSAKRTVPERRSALRVDARHTLLRTGPAAAPPAIETSQAHMGVIRNELARLREEMSRVVGVTTQRVDALEQRLTVRERVPAPPPRPDTDLSPILIRAAAIIERAGGSKRSTPRRDARSPAKGRPPANKSTSTPLSFGLSGDGKVVAPTPEDIAAVVKHLDTDARTAHSLLRAWRTGEAKRSSQGHPTAAN